MEDASPAKRHLAHTSWFFEEFVLRLRAGNPRYQVFDERHRFLFNSYYEVVGPRHLYEAGAYARWAGKLAEDRT